MDADQAAERHRIEQPTLAAVAVALGVRLGLLPRLRCARHYGAMNPFD